MLLKLHLFSGSILFARYNTCPGWMAASLLNGTESGEPWPPGMGQVHSWVSPSLLGDMIDVRLFPLDPTNDPYLLSKTQQPPLSLKLSRAGKESPFVSRVIDPKKQWFCLPGRDDALLRVCKVQKALSWGTLLVIQGARHMAKSLLPKPWEQCLRKADHVLYTEPWAYFWRCRCSYFILMLWFF